MQLGELRIQAGDRIRFDNFVSGREERLVYANQAVVLFVYATTPIGEVIVPVSGLGALGVEVLTK